MSDAYDSPWKEMLERYFPDFLAFFFPDAHRSVDWTRGWESQDQELQKIMREAEIGKRIADKVMKVWRLDGQEQYVFIHVEVQGDHDPGFAERMYVYNYRLYDRHRCPVASLAVLTDDSASWRPDEFGYELWGCQAGLRFPVVKLRDQRDRWPELEASDNPFAVVAMAHLKTGITRDDPAGRLQWKLRLVRRLYQGGYQQRDVLELLRFIDWLLKLPTELDAQFGQEIERLEAETRMQYVTTWERKGIEKGIEKGIQQGEASLLRRQLARRFDRLPDWVEQRLAGASRDELETWADRVLEARALEDVFA
ncbi:MAG: DUF4351 domain-containing protein [bacterium]|nr:DUF4351 domain-containing protein [bacterium]